MKKCDIDCVVLCANCRHWTSGDRFFEETGKCGARGVHTEDTDSCDDFHCVNVAEVTPHD